MLGVGLRQPEDGGEPTPGFEVRARWQVEGQVYHWGHSHTRRIEYLGEYTVGVVAPGWRIVAHRILEQRRLDPDGGEQGDVRRVIESLGGEDI